MTMLIESGVIEQTKGTFGDEGFAFQKESIFPHKVARGDLGLMVHLLGWPTKSLDLSPIEQIGRSSNTI
jgi:hypothetical protein